MCGSRKNPRKSPEIPEDGGGRLGLANIKMSYKIIVTDTMGCKLRDGQISNGTRQCPEISPHIDVGSACDRAGNGTKWEENGLHDNLCWNEWFQHVEA